MNRYDHTKEKILILQDRYYLSTVAYQTISIKDVKKIASFYLKYEKVYKPDLLLYLNAKPQECLNRVLLRSKNNTQKDIDIFETLDRLKKIHRHYHFLLEHLYPYPFKILDASLSKETITKQAIQSILDLLIKIV